MPTFKQNKKRIDPRYFLTEVAHEKAPAGPAGYKYQGYFKRLADDGSKPEEGKKYADVWTTSDSVKPYAYYKIRSSERSYDFVTMKESHYRAVMSLAEGGKCAEQWPHCWQRIE